MPQGREIPKMRRSGVNVRPAHRKSKGEKKKKEAKKKGFLMKRRNLSFIKEGGSGKGVKRNPNSS